MAKKPENLTKPNKAEMKHLVRIAATELKGELPTKIALTYIKGVGNRMADAVIEVLKLDPNQTFGTLSDEDIEKIERCIMAPMEHGVPKTLVNARKSPMSGEDQHLVGSDYIINKKDTLDRKKKIKSYRGVRHALGLKVRGQRTKSTGRHGRAMGVSRKKLKAKTEKKS